MNKYHYSRMIAILRNYDINAKLHVDKNIIDIKKNLVK